MILLDSRASFAIQVLIGLYLVFDAFAITLDIWSLYLEMHLNLLAEWVNHVNKIIPEPTSKLLLVGHLFVCCIQSLVLCALMSAAAEKTFKSYHFGLRISTLLLLIEYAVFLGYVVSTWNHYQYIFITFTFIAIAYKTILCWPLLEFEKVLRLLDKSNKCTDPNDDRYISMSCGLLSAEVIPATDVEKERNVV